MSKWILTLVLFQLYSPPGYAQSNPLWHVPKVKNYLPHMTWPEVDKLLARTDMVAPILLSGVSPYHMEFPGTIARAADTVQRVYFEAAQSPIHRGFRRFLIFTSHTGNQHVSRYIVDRTSGRKKVSRARFRRRGIRCRTKSVRRIQSRNIEPAVAR